MIWLLAVTAVVLTVRVELVVPVGIRTLPAAADPQTAGEAELAQFVAVAKVVPLIAPVLAMEDGPVSAPFRTVEVTLELPSTT